MVGLFRVLSFFIFFFLLSGWVAGEILSLDEQQWLHDHPVITVAVEEDFPPLIFMDDSLVVRGISKDYLDLLEQKLGIKFEYTRPSIRFDTLEKIKSGEVDLITSLSPTDERLEYLNFTQSYFNAPAIIIVSDSEQSIASVSDLKGKKVAVSKGYAVEEYLRVNYPEINLVFESDNKEGSYDLVFGNVDAVVMNISSASYLAPYLKLSGLKAVANAEYDYRFSFATSKNNVILRDILYKGLNSITPEEKKLIYDKWVSIQISPIKNALSTAGFSVLNPYFAMGGLLLVVFLASIFKELFVNSAEYAPKKRKKTKNQ